MIDDPIARFAHMRFAGKIPPLPPDATFIGFIDNRLPGYEHVVVEGQFAGYLCRIKHPDSTLRMPFDHWRYNEWSNLHTIKHPSQWAMALQDG